MDPSPTPANPLRIDRNAIDPDAAKVILRLARHGFRAYLVGGCVRDLLLGRQPKDFDIATSARPRQVRRLFRNSRVIGRRFRLVHIRFGNHVLEVATFRAPPPPADEGSDLYIERDNIFGTEREDAFRRDFTINGLFYDLERKRVIDHVDGVADLDARLIRTIGDPDVRLREDPVRILRAAKFAGRLDFALTPELRAAVERHAGDLEKSAPARILEEIYRLLSNHGSPRAFRLLEELGALQVLIPEIGSPPPSFLDALERLQDQSGGDRDGAPQWLLVAVLCAPIAHAVLNETPVHDLDAALHDALQPLASRLTIARRDASRARHCLAAQVRIAAPPEGRRGRRYARREFFNDALRLRRVVGPLLDDTDPDALAEWEALAREVGAAPGGKKPRRRRRRRRGRRGGLRKSGDRSKDSSCNEPGSSSAPAPPTPPPTSPPNSSNDDSSPA